MTEAEIAVGDKPRLWTSADIESVLVRGLSAKFQYRRWLVIPNVSWGFLAWEADLVAISKDGWMSEVEIKVSVADLRRDLDKDKFRVRQMYNGKWQPTPGTSIYIREFWYAMPDQVWAKVEAAPPIPDYAGVITVTESNISRGRWQVVRKPTKNVNARKLTEVEKTQLLRLCMIKYWAHGAIRSHPSP